MDLHALVMGKDGNEVYKLWGLVQVSSVDHNADGWVCEYDQLALADCF